MKFASLLCVTIVAVTAGRISNQQKLVNTGKRFRNTGINFVNKIRNNVSKVSKQKFNYDLDKEVEGMQRAFKKNGGAQKVITSWFTSKLNKNKGNLARTGSQIENFVGLKPGTINKKLDTAKNAGKQRGAAGKEKLEKRKAKLEALAKEHKDTKVAKTAGFAFSWVTNLINKHVQNPAVKKELLGMKDVAKDETAARLSDKKVGSWSLTKLVNFAKNKGMSEAVKFVKKNRLERKFKGAVRKGSKLADQKINARTVDEAKNKLNEAKALGQKMRTQYSN
jgi:hypothetical protein